MIKLLDDRALKLLAYIINNIKNIGLVLDSFKIAIITPIFKKGNSNKAENYRPISLLTIFSKIFERIIKLRMTNYLKENQILPLTQFNFKKRHNTEIVITSLTQSFLHAIDSKKTTKHTQHKIGRAHV